jgi:Ran GTPase-activating protein (RanGAP) involved in mRNA processing and transport
LHPKTHTNIEILKLDHNNLGAEGVKNLAEGVAVNKNLTSLSLAYCNINSEGARPIFEILIYTQSNLEEINLTGNVLKNEGAIVVLRAIQVNKKLQKFFIADN